MAEGDGTEGGSRRFPAGAGSGRLTGVTTLAVTGHMDLTRASVPLVRTALDDLLASHASESLTGVSCLARGADSVFAEAILAAGGRLVAVIPSRDYREMKVKPDRAALFDRLAAAAAEVLVLEYTTAGREAYEAANQVLIAKADRLVAVWDHTPPSGNGGTADTADTADTVAMARDAGVPVDVVWPDGATRG